MTVGHCSASCFLRRAVSVWTSIPQAGTPAHGSVLYLFFTSVPLGNTRRPRLAAALFQVSRKCCVKLSDIEFTQISPLVYATVR
jgi:hypothetical protein